MQFLRRKDSLESEIHHEFEKPETFTPGRLGRSMLRAYKFSETALPLRDDCLPLLL